MPVAATLRPPVDILLVEDNQADAQLMAEVLRQVETPSRLHHVARGVEALAFLRSEAPFERARRPRLILLDLNLPGLDGHELLKEIRADPALHRIPVVVFSASRDEIDIRRAYDFAASAYICKPAFLDDYIGVVRAMEDFWLRTARLPAP